jgi:hypothetical protein
MKMGNSCRVLTKQKKEKWVKKNIEPLSEDEKG